MTARLIGETGSRKRRRFLFVPILLVACTALFIIAGAQAVHDTGVFQLDGNAQTSVQSTPPGAEDWDKVCPATSPPSRPLTDPVRCLGGTTASRKAFIADAFLQASDNIFKGGTDDADVTGWLWKQAGMSPDKADIEQAFAAQYTVTATGPYQNHKVLFFGGTRLANDGNTNIGLWFFQNPVSAGGSKSGVDANGNPTCAVNSGCGFTGNHRVGNKSLGGSIAGDIFILSAFTNGGEQPTIKIFEWVGPGNATKNYLGSNGCFTSACTLQPLAIPNTPGFNDNRCPQTGAITGGVACAIVNGTSQPSPWLFTDKTTGAPANTFGPAEFYEGGLDLTGLGFGEACFSSVLLNTRSSQSGTSVLQDFALGSFGSCTTDLTTTPKTGAGGALTTDTDNDNLDEISIGSGSVSVQDSALLDVKGVASFTGSLKFFICGPIATGPCTTGGVAAGTKTANANGTYLSDAATLTSVGRYCWRAEFASTTSGVPPASDSRIESAGPPKSTGECFEVMPVQPTLDTAAVSSAVQIGSAVQDNATLSGTTKQAGTNGGTTPGIAGSQYPSINATVQPNAGGKITFTLVKADCLTAPTGTGTNPQDLTVNQTTDPKTYGPVSYTPNATGTYHWQASYTPATGDQNNLTASHNIGPPGCTDADETVKVVDAKISIAESATNAVGDPHTFTVTVMQDDGSGSFAAATVGNVDVTLTVSNGAVAVLDAAASTCDDQQPSGDNLDGSGQCTVTFTSNSAGQVTGHATASLSVAGVALTRATNGVSPNSGDVVKTFVDAKISIAADATNQVGDPHTFTVTAMQDDGLTAAQGGDGTTGFAAATVGNVDVTLTGSNGAVSVLDTAASTCDDNQPSGDNLNGSGQCTVTFTSNSAGLITGHATVNLSVGGVALTRSTNGVSPNSADAVKTFVDAYITINPPEATNTVGDPHTFTVLVCRHTGTPAAPADAGDCVDGFRPALDDTLVDVDLTDSDGAEHELVLGGDTCADPGTVDGECTVTFTSPTAGTVTGHATVVFLVGGVELTRETDGEGRNSGDAIKMFTAGSIAWTKEYAGEPQGGATFSLCRTNNYILPNFGIDVNPLDPPVCLEGGVVDDVGDANYEGNDEDPLPGKFKVSGLRLGRYEITETAAPPGYELDDTVGVAVLEPGFENSNKEITDPFVNSRPILKITGFGYTNEPDGDQPFGITKGTTTYTVNLHNYGTADAELAAGSGLVVSTNATCTDGNTLDLAGETIAEGADSSPYTLTCSYDAPAPPKIEATLTVKYTTNGQTRDASGSPATITFTVGPED